MDSSYWLKQTASKPLFPDFTWSKPERRDQAGKLGIIGGNKLGFAGVAATYTAAYKAGAGQIRVVLPDSLKQSVPSTILHTVFSTSTPSGSLARGSIHDLLALGSWADGVLLAGDAGRNSETAVVYDKFIREFSGPLTITRDAIDLVKNAPVLLIERPQTMVVASFAQVQKMFQGAYYPKMLTFSMQLLQLVEALHKFTITYPLTLVTLHKEQIIIAHAGNVVSQDFDSPLRIWRGDVAARMASYWLWNPDQPLEAASASILSDTSDYSA